MINMNLSHTIYMDGQRLQVRNHLTTENNNVHLSFNLELFKYDL